VIPTLCLAAVLVAQPADPVPVPPPLTAEQAAQVRALVQTHQREQADLRGRLETAQRRLAECYAKFDLDAAEVQALQGEILDLQGKLLHGYHAMQTELRKIVGPERFAILSRRIDNAIRNSPEPRK